MSSYIYENLGYSARNEAEGRAFEVYDRDCPPKRLGGMNIRKTKTVLMGLVVWAQMNGILYPIAFFVIYGIRPKKPTSNRIEEYLGKETIQDKFSE